MSTFSDVAIAIKTELYDSLDPKLRGWLLVNFDTTLKHEEGILFHTSGIKWYQATHEPITALYKAFYDHDPDGESYYIIDACHCFPESDDGDEGGWIENPWGIRKAVQISIEFDDSNSERIY
jgi:hypothetical protein